jgi:hypothetical protein
MHRVILGLADGDPTQVDHRNHDGLDNRRSNLRTATPPQNNGNQLKRKGTTSKYKGVSRYKGRRWRAAIQRRHLGIFGSEEAAATAYNVAASEVFGEYAHLNVV